MGWLVNANAVLHTLKEENSCDIFGVGREGGRNLCVYYVFLFAGGGGVFHVWFISLRRRYVLYIPCLWL